MIRPYLARVGRTARVAGRACPPCGHMSNNFVQLNPSLPVMIPGKGNGFAFAVIDYGEEHHLMWVVAMDDTGEIWTVPNPNVRVQNNWTMGRTVKPLSQAEQCESQKKSTSP